MTEFMNEKLIGYLLRWVIERGDDIVESIWWPLQALEMLVYPTASTSLSTVEDDVKIWELS
jgi:hypothetical protein